MPEMPEVEALARFLSDRAVGRSVVRVRPYSVSAVKTFDPPLDALESRIVVAATRYGKFLVLATDGSDGEPLHLVVNFALAGWLRWYDEAPTTIVKPNGYINLRLLLDDGAGFDLTEAGTRHSLAIWAVRAPRDVPRIAALGPDALALDLAAFAALLAGRRMRIKGLLRDQSIIAGIGNAYSDEILHAAKMSPYALASSLGPDDVARLFGSMRGTLDAAIAERSGRPPAELKDAKRASMRVHGRDGQACPVCGDRIRSVKFADSSFQYCPTCQTGGRPLADRVLSRIVK